MLPQQIKNFIEIFSRLPSIGPRAATRLAFYIIKLDRQKLDTLASSLGDLQNIDKCKNCFFLKESSQPLCKICCDTSRDKQTITIVEKETDLLTIEKSGEFHGNYLIVGDLSENNILETSHKLRLQNLKVRIETELGGKVKEIIIGLNPNTLGDLLHEIITQEFKDLTSKITRLGRGIPTGGEVEFADPETLRDALKRRL